MCKISNVLFNEWLEKEKGIKWLDDKWKLNSYFECVNVQKLRHINQDELIGLMTIFLLNKWCGSWLDNSLLAKPETIYDCLVEAINKLGGN